MIKRFSENNQRLSAVDYFRKKAMSQMYDRVPNTPLITIQKVFEKFAD